MNRKNAIITGSSKGIGRAIVEKLVAEGFNVAINSRSAEDLKAFEADLKKIDPNAEVLWKATDVSKKEEVVAFADLIKSKWSQVDMLVNNAGIFKPGMLAEEEENALESQIETNLYSAYHMTRATLPLMLPQKAGHIFNMCSIASKVAYPNGGSYSISKFALLGFSKVLREEMKEQGLRVTAILPGATWSNSWAGVDLPKERLMEAKDIANTLWAAYQLGDSAVMEEVIIRPQLGDL